MKFISTRGGDVVSTSSEAIVKGLASDGGLFVPEYFPDLKDKLASMLEMSYPEIATTVIGSFLEEYDKENLLTACKEAYAKFDDENTVPVVKIKDGVYVLELFHGPTLAFKDVALTLLPYLLRTGADYLGIKDQILILVATSGDTGKAALEGFKNAKGIKINVFYPEEGVSDMQKLQMRTQEGENVNVVSVKGNFDDCQTAVKKIFSDKEYGAKLKEKGIMLSSANSINFGRLVPQISYYFSAYCDLVNANQINMGDEIDFCVPTGNFGNILAGYYAKKMGLPVRKLICASNKNNVLTEFFTDGIYDSNREFFKTMSPSMDILISSNLERLVYEFSKRDAGVTKSRMNELKLMSRYSLTKQELNAINEEFIGGFCDEDECLETIADFFDETGYVLDTHTGVAAFVASGFIEDFNSKTPMVILSTASPYKFPQNVLKAITGKMVADAFTASAKLEAETAYPIPEQITGLKTKEVRFSKVVDKNGTMQAVEDFIKEFQV